MSWALASACIVGGAAAADDLGDGTFVMPQQIISAATAFADYVKSASTIDSGFTSGDEVAHGLKVAASYEPTQIEEGMIAYGAIAALQDDRFVEGVDQAAGRGQDRDAFAERLVEDPYAATRVDGADGAARRIEVALRAVAQPLISTGAQIKQAAYSVQHQAWSKVMVADAQVRLADVKVWSRQAADPGADDTQAMMEKIGAEGQRVGDDASAGYSQIEARALALAAEAVLGHAHGADRDRLSPLLTEADSAECFRMAKLNLYQCMAVAGPQYEDMFCMGQHAVMDTGSCVDGAARSAARTAVAALSPRPAQAGAAYVQLASHRTLRADPN
ncbi:MAG TPA: hypothetical protein VGL58_09930 [Caulobacteraceae bacterium]